MVHARSRRLLFPCKFVCLLRGKGEKLSPFPLSNLLGCCPVEQPFYLYALLYSWEVCCSTSLQSVLKLERKYTKHLSYLDTQTCEPRLLFRPVAEVLVVLAWGPLVQVEVICRLECPHRACKPWWSLQQGRSLHRTTTNLQYRSQKINRIVGSV